RRQRLRRGLRSVTRPRSPARALYGVAREVERERVDRDLGRAAEARREERSVQREEAAQVMVLARRADDARLRIASQAERAHGMNRRERDAVRADERRLEGIELVRGRDAHRRDRGDDDLARAGGEEDARARDKPLRELA